MITILKRNREELELSQKKYFKKTAKGKVQKILKERYLRDDIPCGSKFCSVCSYEEEAQPSLPEQGFTGSNLIPRGHYVIPDTNAFLHQMDLLTSPLLASLPIIVLQTVLDEVRHRSLPLFNRLKQLIADEDSSVWVYWNEAAKDTATVRVGLETPNDKNDRAIRSALKWYNHHLSPSSSKSSKNTVPTPFVIMISDDADNLRKTRQDGLTAYTVRQYVEGLKESPAALLDLLAVTGSGVAEDSGEKREGRKALYEDYIPSATLLSGIKSGKLHKGYFNANQYNYLEGSVNTPSFAKPILLIGRQDMNRSVNGDEVVVEVFPESEWKAPGESVVDQDDALRNDDADDSEGEDLVSEEVERQRKDQSDAAQVGKANPLEKQPTGRVVGIFKRNWRAYVCHLDSTSLSTHNPTSLAAQTVFATPLSALLPRIRIRTRQAPVLLNQKILVSIDRWDISSRYPEGHFVRSLGAVESKEAEQESLLLEYDVPYRPFGKAILNCLPKEGESWVVPPKDDDPRGDWRGREDLRDMVICSIDPPGCQDIDDALHARPLPNGNIEAGVHIADVSHFVHPSNPMDEEAASRGTTVYLVDKRIDMLPSLLGTNLCSLRPFVERLAFTCIWEMTPEAEIVNVRFTKSVIASKAAFTYADAQARMDDSSKNDPITLGIRLLNQLAIKLRAARMKAGALNLASPEVKINLQSPESSDPIDVEQKELLATNSLVEEFMLLANCSVAAKIEETFPQTAVLRRHGAPPKTNFENLDDLLNKTRGMHLDASSSAALAKSLDHCVVESEPAFNTLVRILATRCMLSAEYICSGSFSKDSYMHYGLAAPIYTHFTSPIRRYADVLAHRQLSAAIGYTQLHASLSSQQYVERIMHNINKRHRMAQQAGRASVEFYVGLALKARGMREGKPVEVREEAFVIRVFRNGVAVYVHKLGLEGLVTFKKETHTFESEEYSITLPASSKSTQTVDGAPIKKSLVKKEDVKLRVFDKVAVNITVEKDKNTQRGKVQMSLVWPVDSKDL
ncbi:Exosomal 3'-5' exoribonuclease complex, subunit Rrp44/Dis3 [Phaffia rhodozyma]|uniref:Ribosomal RNA-processing protein 44 n=1 Tax=Phaffia rhodozyma TaxID=264483 RepID=A0A0F7STU8_PHARH|nr:Exosomal 3'-5' exoribonuclease complex, subunit Rrp44/Dis3 [Phaffia rhodozyma]